MFEENESRYKEEAEKAEKRLRDSFKRKGLEKTKSIRRKNDKKKRMQISSDMFDENKAKLFREEAQKEEDAREVELKQKVLNIILNIILTAISLQ